VRESSSDFRHTLKELIDASPEPEEHPSPDLWLAYQRGELPAHEEERLQEHLARCRDCFDLAEGAAAFAQPDTDQEVETAALWRLLRPQLVPSPENVREISSAPRRRPSWGHRLPSLLAASFFVALVGLTVWNLRQQSALEALRAPRPNVQIFDLFAEERPGEEATLTAGERILAFHPDPDEELAVYRLVIRDAASGRELSSYELQPDKDGALTLDFPELRPGRYRLELSGGGRLLETHLLRVTEPDRGE